MSKNLGLKERLHDANKEERTSILDGLPYEVGFGKPPRATRFSAGNQAGRRGRPKGSENLSTILEEEASVRIDVTDGGKTRKMSKQRVAVRQLLNKMASGDIKAFTVYAELLRKSGRLQPSAGETPAVDQRDLEMFERLAAFYDTADLVRSQEAGEKSHEPGERS